MSAKSLTPRGFTETQAPPNDGDVWTYDAATDKSVPKAQTVQFLPVTWSPADATLDEADAAVIVLPAPCLLLGAYWRRVAPTDAASTPTLQVADDQGVFDTGAFKLASDTTTLFGAAYAATSFGAWAFQGNIGNGWPGGLSLSVPLSFTFAYVAGITPGATTPVFALAFAYLPIA